MKKKGKELGKALDNLGKGGNEGSKSSNRGHGFCVCPKCGHKIEHQANEACNDIKCPECGTNLTIEQKKKDSRDGER